MQEDKQKEVFKTNLNRLLSIHGKSQREVAEAIDVSPQTFNTWCQGIALPRMGKIQKLADYFGVPKSQLIDEHSPHSDSTMQFVFEYNQLETDYQTLIGELIEIFEHKEQGSDALMAWLQKFLELTRPQ